MKTSLLVFAAGLAISGCKQEPAGAAEGAEVQITEAELAALVAWQRDFAHQVNVALAAWNGATEATIPALTADHRRKMALLQDRQPLKGHRGVAVGTVVQAIGRWRNSPATQELIWDTTRDEAALADARKQYGDELVDWILAREHLILAGGPHRLDQNELLSRERR